MNTEMMKQTRKAVYNYELYQEFSVESKKANNVNLLICNLTRIFPYYMCVEISCM